MTTAETAALSQQVGKIDGKVDALGERVGGLERGQREFAAQSSREHAEVRRDFKEAVREIKEEMTSRLDEQHGRIDGLEAVNDRERGAEDQDKRRGRQVSTFVAGLFSLAGLVVGVLTVLAATGHI